MYLGFVLTAGSMSRGFIPQESGVARNDSCVDEEPTDQT